MTGDPPWSELLAAQLGWKDPRSLVVGSIDGPRRSSLSTLPIELGHRCGFVIHDAVLAKVKLAGWRAYDLPRGIAR